MTKLEQCVRLVHAIDTEGSVETRYEDSGGPSADTPVFCAVALRSPEADQNLDDIAYGRGATLEEAIEALHGVLKDEAVRMRIALDGFEFDDAAEGEEA